MNLMKIMAAQEPIKIEPIDMPINLGIEAPAPPDPNKIQIRDPKTGKALTGPLEGSKSKTETPATYDAFSYVSLIQDLNRFRATAFNTENMFDMPGQVFFRVLFHFNNDSDVMVGAPGVQGADIAGSANNSYNGLIGPSWLQFGDTAVSDIQSRAQQSLDLLWAHSTAFNYFIINNDLQRAANTKKFVELLSSISANSPWYFQNIKGLDTAIERQVANGEFMFKDERDKITIECLDDSYDQRIGTLLDLYRAIVWSWETKRIMLPSNLRKFDMTIIAFQLPIEGMHIARRKQFTSTNKILPMQRTGRYPMSDTEVRGDKKSNHGLSELAVTDKGLTVIYDGNPGNSAPVASYKAWEFHGCEIDYNSSKSGWSDLSNSEGSVPKFNIDIFFDDMFEIRFNEFLMQHVTDLNGDNAPVIINSESEVNQSFYDMEQELADLMYNDTEDEKKWREGINKQFDDKWKGKDTSKLTEAEKKQYEDDVKARDSATYTSQNQAKIEALSKKMDSAQIKTSTSLELPNITNIIPVPNNTISISTQSQLNGRNIFNGKPSRGSGIIDQIIGHGQAWLETKLKKVYLGNMNGLSLSKVRQQVETAIDGDLFATAANIANYVRGNYNGGSGQLGENIFPAPTGTDQDRIINLGNIFKANTALNS